MAEAARKFPDPFRSTSEDERQEIVDAILRGAIDYGAPSDEDLVFLANQRFFELDCEEESQD